MISGDAHNVTLREIKKIKALGFKVEHAESKYPADFVNEYFPGLDFFKFLSELHSLLKPIAEGNLEQTVNMSDAAPPMLLIVLYGTDFNDDDRDLVFERTFIRYPEQLVVEHDYFSLPLDARMQGLSKKVTACCLKQYLNMGVDKIRVHATLEDGRLIWAKFGFKAVKKAEVTAILISAKRNLNDQQFSIIERFYNAYYENEPEGAAFPMEDWGRLVFMEGTLRGSDWYGELDLTDQKELLNFKNYVAG